MNSQPGLEVLKDIPGYKAILKSVLKSQIQLLIEQLADHTGEESIILTASVSDGALSHLGSSTGKGFLEGRDEIKSQFLGYCLNSHHQKKNEHNSSPYQRESPMIPTQTARRARPRKAPYSMSMSPRITSPTSLPRSSASDVNSYSHAGAVMSLAMDTSSQPDFLNDVQESSLSQGAESMNDYGQQERVEENGSISLVKREPGEEPGQRLALGGEDSLSSETWGQGYSLKQNSDGADQSGYNSSEQAQNDVPISSEPLGGIAFPGLDNLRHDFSTAPSNALPEISPRELKQALYPEGKELDTSLSHQLPMTLPSRASDYWCGACNKRLQNRTLYEYHIRAHSGVKPYVCQICQRRFAGKQVLETHMRLHSGEKPFKCEVEGCDKAFVARSGLFYHVKKHHPK